MLKQIQYLLDLLGLNVMLLIGGAIGAWIGLKNDKPWWVQVITVLTGAFIANYTAPVVIDIFGMEKTSLGGVGFITGYSGKAMLEYIIEKFKKDGKGKS